MSWLIQNLLNNSLETEAKSDFESDEFNDLLLIKKAIEELSEKGVFTNDDLEILNYFSQGNRPSDTKVLLNRNRDAVVKHYESVCERLAFYLGSYFTNDGYIDYMVNKYNLTLEQEETMKNFIKSKYKHSIIRNLPNNDYK